MILHIVQTDLIEPTLFSFPSRHRSTASEIASSFSVHFITPTGLHPSIRLNFPRAPLPPDSSCLLHTYLTIPSQFFPDKYQLSSPNFLASKNLRALHALSGETDLEAPDWAISQWGSAMLLELTAPPSTSRDPWSAEIPLHLRYMSPGQSVGSTASNAQATASLPWPVIFWACPAEEGTKMNTNPFDRINLGYDSLFGARTMFYHLHPSSNGTLVETISVPALNLDQVSGVERGTLSILLLGFFWISWWLLRTSRTDPSKLEAMKGGKRD